MLPAHARVVELAYTADLKSATFNGMWVQIPPLAPWGLVFPPVRKKVMFLTRERNRGANAKNSCESGNNTRTSFHVHIYSATLRVTAALRAKSKATLAISGKGIDVIKNCFLNVVESHRHIALLAGICGKGRGNTCLSLFAK